MVAVPRFTSFSSRQDKPRLILDGQAGPRVRLRLWEAERWPEPSRAAAHGGVELAWVTEGRVGYGIGGQEHVIGPGEAMLVPSEVEHATSFIDTVRASAIWVDREIVAELGDALGQTRAPSIGPRDVALGARIATLGDVLAKEVRAGDRGGLLAADAIVEAMLVIALRAAGASGASSSASAPGAAPANDALPRDPAIAAAVRFVQAEYREPITVDQMARAAKMSRFHFSRRFRDATGRSPYRFLLEHRLERAAELLRRGRHGVTEAAFSVGFADSSRFARAFRERFGVAPARYASEARTRLVIA